MSLANVTNGNWYDYDVGRFRVEIAKSQDGGHWETIATGIWEPGSDPVLQGENVPQPVLQDLLGVDTAGQESGTFYAQAGYVRYKLVFLPG